MRINILFEKFCDELLLFIILLCYFFRHGSTMTKLDIDVENGGMKLDENFLIDFGADKNEVLLAHEMR